MPFPGRENQAPYFAAIAWRKRWSSGFLKSIWRMLWSTYTTAVSTWTRSTPKSSNCIIAIVPVASCASVWSTRSAISVPGTRSPRTRWSSRIVRARDGTPSVSQERADALDGLEVMVMAHGPDRPTVDERLVHGEVEAVVRPLHARAVERALAVLDGDSPAARTARGCVAGAFLEEEQVDAPVRGGLERLLPAGRRAPVPSRFLSPALERTRLLLGAPVLEHGRRKREQFGSLRMRLRVR